MAETKSKKSKLFPNEPLVTIKLPITRTEKDDVWVAVNGKSMQIKRGVEVEVPKCIAEVLQHKEEMLMQAIEFESNAMGKADDSELN
jgi:F0F1-type ATP synthase alpha subunit